MEKIKRFSIPDFTESATQALVFLYLTEPHIFHDDVVIDNIFGNYADNRMNGGRVYKQTEDSVKFNVEKLHSFLNILSSADIGLRFVFTNSVITREMLTEEEFDTIETMLRMINRTNINSCTIYQPWVHDFVSQFENIQRVSSVTKYHELDVENYFKFLEKENKNHEILVLDHNFNHQIETLKTLPIEIRNKLEPIVDFNCAPYCPTTFSHYEMCSKAVVEGLPFPYCNSCQAREDEKLYGRQVIYPTNLQPKDLNAFIDIGINKFKLPGRTNNRDAFINKYNKFLIKSQYHDLFKETVNNWINLF